MGLIGKNRMTDSVHLNERKFTSSDLVQFMKIEWTDIHHSRNQEWRFLAIIAAAFAALFVFPMSLTLQIAVTVFGLILCLMGIYISIAHWIIFYGKIQVIRQCEKILGMEFYFRHAPVPVQGMMVSAFFLLTSAILGWLIWLLSGNPIVSSTVSVGVFIGGLLFCVLPSSPLRKYMNYSGPASSSELESSKLPLIAELDDLIECLNLMGPKPLKLVANDLWETESPWNESKWSFVSSNREVQDRKLFLNPRDDFEFSIAGKDSNQDFHVHQAVFEIYVSYSKIGIVYFSDEREKTIRLEKGVLIVPPMVRHKVQLGGPTFVFQHAIGGAEVHNDKEIVE